MVHPWKSQYCVTWPPEKFSGPDAGTDTQGRVFKMLQETCSCVQLQWLDLEWKGLFFLAQTAQFNRVLTNDQWSVDKITVCRDTFISCVTVCVLCQAIFADWPSVKTNFVFENIPAVTSGYL